MSRETSFLCLSVYGFIGVHGETDMQGLQFNWALILAWTGFLIKVV